jgi:hypothetical protein
MPTNIKYFHAKGMLELSQLLEDYQNKTDQTFCHISVHFDNGFFCCIALINTN